MMKKGKLFMMLRDVFAAPLIWADTFVFALICILHIFLEV